MRRIEVFGVGCAKCKQAFEVMGRAARELGIEHTLEKVEDLSVMADRGILGTPAVAVDGKVVLSGRVPTLEEAKRLLSS